MTSLSRFTTALANPRTRTVASSDPLTITENPALIGATAIAAGTNLDFTSGLIRPVRGRGTLQGGTNFNVDQLHRDGTNPTSVEPTGFEVLYTGRYFEFCFSSEGQRYHIWVDGVLSKSSGYLSVAADSTYHFTLIDFGSRAAAGRRIRIEMQGSKPFGYIRRETSESLLNPAPVRPCNMLLVGDSFHEPSFPTYKIDGIPTLLGEKLGVDNVIPSASGGTGFSAGNLGAGKANFAQRIVKEVTLYPASDPAIDVVLFCASGNDAFNVGAPYATLAEWQAGYTTDVNFCLSTARTAWPGAVILVMSHAQPQGGLGTDGAFKEGALAAACPTYGARWIGGLPDAILASPGYATWYHADGHPNDLGHAGISSLMNTLIRSIIFVSSASVQSLFKDKLPYAASLNARLAEFFLSVGASPSLVSDYFRDSVPYALSFDERIALVLTSLGKSPALFGGRKTHAATFAQRLEEAFA